METEKAARLAGLGAVERGVGPGRRVERRPGEVERGSGEAPGRRGSGASAAGVERIG